MGCCCVPTLSIADTLGMKKDLLSDPDTCVSFCASLSLRLLLQILQKFVPDAFSNSNADRLRNF